MVLTLISLIGVFWMLYSGKKELHQEKNNQQALEQNIKTHHSQRGKK
jgi:spermidine/putrescine transport system permease protein